MLMNKYERRLQAKKFFENLRILPIGLRQSFLIPPLPAHPLSSHHAVIFEAG